MMPWDSYKGLNMLVLSQNIEREKLYCNVYKCDTGTQPVSAEYKLCLTIFCKCFILMGFCRSFFLASSSVRLRQHKHKYYLLFTDIATQFMLFLKTDTIATLTPEHITVIQFNEAHIKGYIILCQYNYEQMM